MTQAGLRQASFRAIGGTAGSINEDMLAAFATEAPVPPGTSFNGAFILWLQARLESSETDLNSLMTAFAVANGATNWASLGSFPAGGFSPAAIPDLVFWYDATDSTPTEDSGVLTALSNRVVGGDPLVAGTAGGTLADNVFGARKGVLFSGAQDYEIGAGLDVPSEGTYFAVAKPSSLHIGGIIGRGCQNNSTPGATLRVLTNTAVQMTCGNGTARADESWNGVYEPGDQLRLVGRWSTTDVRCNLDGSNDPDDPSGGHTLGDCSTTSNLRVGNTDAQFAGHIGAVGFYSRYLTDPEVDQLAAYLAGLYPDA
jgi:hypothetical protein